MENLLGLKKILSPFFLVLGLALVGLCACGSGSTSTPPPPQPISYTGLTTQATVRDNNAHDLATGSYQGGTLVSAGGLQPMQERAAERSRYLNLVFSVEEAINKIDVQATPAIPSSSTVTKSIESSSITGSCGGSGQYTIDYNANTEDFSGTINFNSYCSQGVTLTGTASFSTGGVRLLRPGSAGKARG